MNTEQLRTLRVIDRMLNKARSIKLHTHSA